MAADEKIEEEEILKEEMVELDKKTRELAYKLREIAGIDCEFGEYVHDDEMGEIEGRLAEVQRRKKLLEGILEHLEKEQ